jgi:hypothetical protein
MPKRQTGGQEDEPPAYVNGGYFPPGHKDYPGYTAYDEGYTSPKDFNGEKSEQRNGVYTVYPHIQAEYAGYTPYEPDDDRERRRRNSSSTTNDGGDAGHSSGVDDTWRTAYPYVPTSYNAKTNTLNSRGESFALEGAKKAAPDGGGGGEETPEGEEREKWGSQWEFIFSCIGLSVGIGNVWRFPTLAYENGGGSFLIPYFIILLVIGKPMYYMELALGQFVQQGPVGVWRLCPLGYGVGVAQVVTNIIVSIYYNVIMGYCLFYIFASFQSEVPWSKCSADWFQVRTEAIP